MSAHTCIGIQRGKDAKKPNSIRVKTSLAELTTTTNGKANGNETNHSPVHLMILLQQVLNTQKNTPSDCSHYDDWGN
jgi:hypothetical protein